MSTRATDTLTALDATFLELEQLDQGALMSIGGVMVFDACEDRPGPVLDEVQASVAARLHELPRYLQRLSRPRVHGFSWQHWEADDNFDIANHIRRAALPAPGTAAELCDWTAEFFSHPLDRTRPLWEMVLIEGLQEGRWALAHKTHHCLVDGVGSVDVVDLLLDSKPELPGANGQPTHAGYGSDNSSVARGEDDHRRALEPPDALVQAARAGRHALGAGVHAALHPVDALERSAALAELFIRDELIAAPETSLSVTIGQSRRYATVTLPLAELKAIGKALGGTVNDVVLTACGSGLRALLLERGESLPEQGLRAMVPMNLRDASSRLSLGNRVTSLFVDLPVVEESPAVRLATVAARTRRLKASGAARGASALLDLAELAPPVLLQAALARTMFSRRLFNLTITNVPGPKRPLYAFGAQMRELYPVVPLAADHTVGIAIFSYNGLVTFGINADLEATPDLGVLAYGIEEGLEDLLSLAGASHTNEEMRI